MTVWDAMGRCLRGEWLLKQGDASGLPVLRQALGELSEAGFRMRFPAHLGSFAEGLAVHGDVDAARVAIDEAIAMSAGSGELWCMPELLRIKGDMLRTAGSAEAARDLYVQALEAARAQGALSWELRAANSLAEQSFRSGETEQAEDLLSSICSRFQEGFGTRDVRKARSLLNDIRKTLYSTSREGHDPFIPVTRASASSSRGGS
jgi:predicted ATPase